MISHTMKNGLARRRSPLAKAANEMTTAKVKKTSWTSEEAPTRIRSWPAIRRRTRGSSLWMEVLLRLNTNVWASRYNLLLPSFQDPISSVRHVLKGGGRSGTAKSYGDVEKLGLKETFALNELFLRQ